MALVDFPVSLAVAAPSRARFVELRNEILAAYPAVQDVYFWPILEQTEGYYAGPLSSPSGLKRAMSEAQGLPTLWDLEFPRAPAKPQWNNWLDNRSELASWLAQRDTPVHVWRTYAFLGLDPLPLRLAGFHFDPSNYPWVWLHLDLYRRGQGLPHALTARIMRCGVERYGEHFIPSLGVLDDGQGSPDEFVSPAGLQGDLEAARAAGVSQVWLFGLNGLNAEYLAALHASLPLQDLPAQ
ncbi:MAG: hypothetical protein ABI847_03340 [Anaerolineales bacterium]